MKISKMLTIVIALMIALSAMGCAFLQRNVIEGQIIFQANREGKYGLYVMNPGGSDLRELTSTTGNGYIPDTNSGLYPSPDGKRVAFYSDHEGNSEIYVIDLKSGLRTNLTNNPADDSSFSWSADAAHIAFVSDRDATLMDANKDLWTNNIYVMDSDGANVRMLTYNNTSNQYGQLSWSPDGNKLAFSMSSLSPYGRFYSAGIGTINLNDSRLTRLTPSTGFVQVDPVWSPDGRYIMYFVVGSKLSDVYVMKADGSGQIALSENTLGFVRNAYWSPDGSLIVFSSCRNESCLIYTVKADGANLLALSMDPSSYDTSPSWSPDGKYIVFASQRDGGKYHLYIMNADGTNQRQLTNGPGEEAAPIWLP